jgi:hypothetical protein
MKILKSFSLIATFALVIGSIFGVVKGLSMLCLLLGLGELISAKEYYDNKGMKQAIIYLILGIGICVCGILSFINII